MSPRLENCRRSGADGFRCHERKLVDEFGGLEQAIAHAKELADSEEDLKIEEFLKSKTP